MIVLAIDTAGTGCFAAVYDSGSERVLGSAGAEIGKGHAEQLMAFVDEALAASGKMLSDLDRIAVTIGPGSFTGIRVGVAAARGFALALGIPAVGVSTLAAIARSAGNQHAGRSVLAAMDAKRDELYWQIFDADGKPRADATVVLRGDADMLLEGFDGVICGSAAPLLTGVHSMPDHPDRADIGVVARIGATIDPGTGAPSPLYLRGPDVKSQAGFAVARA